MRSVRSGSRRFLLIVLTVAIAFAVAASPAAATRFVWMQGYDDPATPDQYDKVGLLKEGSPFAGKILILVPGTSGGAGYMRPLAQDIVARTHGWQVWVVERRENLLEDHSVLDKVKRGEAGGEQLFNYYFGISSPGFVGVPDFSVPFARGWGMRVAVEDLRRVVKQARLFNRQVVLGGHSLGGSITTAYATWDFDGRAGAEDLSGLVFVDGGSGAATLTAEQATASLANLAITTPWLSFGGIPSPFTGVFNILGSTLAKIEPAVQSRLQDFPLLPAFLKPPMRATSEAGYGYALDTETSPPNLAAAQVHAGHLAAGGDPRGWDDAGELSPIQRVADAFSGTGLIGVDGTAWYHPRRLTIDSGAVGAGITNPAQAVLDVRSTHGQDLSTPIYAFAAALGGQRVIDAARLLATQSGIPDKRVTLIDGSATYAHVDPMTAYPVNDFVANLVPFLKKTKHVKKNKHKH
jgi:pimeloyl-ACP methyl ester carboxylesterase